MPRLSLSDLAVRRGPNRVVDGLTVEITSGSIFWVVGPNGAGKTSLLRVIAGLDRPDHGTVARAGRHRFLYFHSEMTLPGWSTVGGWDRLLTGVAPDAGPPTPLRPALAPGRWIRRLSTGERKRLLLDGLLRVPGSLLLDEPYEHLAPAAKADLSRLLRQRARAHVVVVVTNQAEHRTAPEYGIRLAGGRALPLAPGGAGRRDIGP